MRIQCDSLKYARLLKRKGFKSCEADGLMSTLTEIEIFNIHSQHEVNTMIRSFETTAVNYWLHVVGWQVQW